MEPPLPRASAALAPDAAVMAGALEAKMVGFCRLLRQQGFRVGLAESQDAQRVARDFLCTDFPAFQAGLRTLLCNGRDELATFDRLFEGWWCPADGASRIELTERTARVKRERQTGGVELTLGLADAPDTAEPGTATLGATRLETLRRTDFSQVSAADQQRLERLARRLWRRMALNLTRRLKNGALADTLHFRRTFRRNLARGGEPVELVLAGRRRRKPRLVVLLDVSGSMELYSFVFLRLLHALQGSFRHVHSFVFSTRLEEITAPLRARELPQALAAVGRRKLAWHGGTRIGDCLDELLECHGPRVFRQDTVLVVLSDGLDVGEPERLARALDRIRLRTRAVVWLNPLLGQEGYEPLARGMAAALPRLDVFAPAHSLESLLQLERHLARAFAA